MENDQAEWMWRMSERNGCVYISDEDTYLRLAKKQIFKFFFLY